MAKKENANKNWFEYIRSPHLWVVKKYVHDMIPNTYDADVDNILARICSGISTQEDMNQFGKLCVKIYEGGYLKAIQQYEEQLKSHGLSVNIHADLPETTNNKIFN